MRTYGPVPSRRFGLSLGVDVVPMKTCSFDCNYCQLGPTDCLTVERQDFYPLEEILADVRAAIAEGPRPDVLTLAGSGEPTLYRSLDALIERLKNETGLPVLLITNSSLLWQDEVARAAQLADILAPSFDAGDEAAYRRINQPHHEVTLERLRDGLIAATAGHPGEVRLEIMVERGINDDEESLLKIAQMIEGVRCDRIDINTPVRPPVPERGALPAFDDALAAAQRIFGARAEPIGHFGSRVEAERGRRGFTDFDKDVRETLRRRPSTADDLAASLGAPASRVGETLDRLLAAGLIEARATDTATYFHALITNEPPATTR